MSAIRRFACAALALCASWTAWAETVNCTDVREVANSITAPGVYCLKSAPIGPDNRIWIGANDVVLDLNGHAIDVPIGAGITVEAGMSGITIRNGTLRGGTYGVYVPNSALARSSRIVVEQMQVERATGAAIVVLADASVVRHNLVLGVGSLAIGAKCGICGAGNGLRISDNMVVDVMVLKNGGQVDGIRVVDAPGAVIERNMVSTAVAGSAGGYPVGINLYRTASSTTPMQTTVAGNRVTNMRTGILNSADASLFLDNTVGGAATPFSGGVMAGTTNYSF